MTYKTGTSKRYLKILENKIKSTYKGCGTILFDCYEELAWLLNEKDVYKLKSGIDILNTYNYNICLIKKENKYYLDYISF